MRSNVAKAFWIYLSALILMAFSLRSHAKMETKKTPKADKKTEAVATKGKEMFALFETSKGNFKVKLYDEWSPKTVENFVSLAEGTSKKVDKKYAGKKFYDGLVFHRIIDGFMIQGGDPEGTGMGGPGYKFDNEKHPMAKHSKAGILAMANAGPNTNGCQFYITVAPQPRLDEGYTVFGETVEGIDVVQAIGKVKTGPMDRPVEPVVIKHVTIERK